MSRHDVLAALQRVPDELLLRSIAADPAVLLASDVWPRVPTARNAGRDDELSALWRAERRFSLDRERLGQGRGRRDQKGRLRPAQTRLDANL